ncbi:MAG: hypothetical protein EOO41_04615 [Methanobacteriota archaeon]|nr:MAG: hypothetical protein EOO41_04615 [Euryarchaeota archaeon]
MCRLATRAHRELATYSVRNITSLLESFSAVKASAPALFKTAAEELGRRGGEASARELSAALLGAVRGAVGVSTLKRLHAHSDASMAHWQAAAQMVNALAAPLADAAAAGGRRFDPKHAQHLTPQGLSMSMWAIARTLQATREAAAAPPLSRLRLRSVAAKPEKLAAQLATVNLYDPLGKAAKAELSDAALARVLPRLCEAFQRRQNLLVAAPAQLASFAASMAQAYTAVQERADCLLRWSLLARQATGPRA